MKEDPGTDLQFSRAPMTVEITRSEQPTVERDHMPVNHVAGAIGCGIVKGQSKGIGIGAELMNCIQSRSRQIQSAPWLPVSSVRIGANWMVHYHFGLTQ